MTTAELIKKVKKIEIKTRGLSQMLFSGEYHSAFKGRGMSFSEVRNYTFGDDVRNIDWNVTARTGDPFVKVFEEERELTVMLLVDISSSMSFGTKGSTKHNIATELAAVLAFSAIQNNDKVGLILFSDHVELYIPPKKGKKHILRMIREMLFHERSGRKTNIEEALHFFTRVVKKRSICFVLSDFLTEGYDRPLRFAARRHDLIGVRLEDAFEGEVPAAGMIRMQDPETGKRQTLDTSSAFIREKLQAYFQHYKQEFIREFRRAGADVMEIKTHEPYDVSLRKFFKRRMR